MAESRSIDRPTFLTYLRQSGLLSSLQLEFVERHLPDMRRARPIARTLVELGLLTRFQAERLLIGRTSGFLLGQYRILDQIGRGGMGRVFKAEHRTMNRIVALKVLAPELMKTERAQDLFIREVRAAARLVHPNIVHAYDANEVNGRYYLVLEFVDGPNLDQLVRERGPLSVGLACDYIRQAATGLTAAHAIGMVHRDIKPANILVQQQGDSPQTPGLVKLSDFGLARLHAPNASMHNGSLAGTILLRENTVMGTPDFLSPEQSKNLHNTDIRSDLYSLGCTFYFLLVGRVPFPGGTSMDKLIRHSTDEAEPIPQLRADVPAPVVAMVRKLMAKAPEARFQTPTELAGALEPYAVSGPIPWAPQPVTPLTDDLDDREPIADTIAANSIDVEQVHADFDFDEEGNDDLAALASTVAPDQALTPLAPQAPAPIIHPPRAASPTERERQYPVGQALLWATAIVGGVLACFFLLSALLGGR